MIDQPLKPARLWLSFLPFGAAFYACAEVGRMLSVPAFSYVSFWLPAGLCVDVLLPDDTRTWPWFLLAGASANSLFDHWSGTPFVSTLGFYGANTLEAATGGLGGTSVGHPKNPPLPDKGPLCGAPQPARQPRHWLRRGECYRDRQPNIRTLMQKPHTAKTLVKTINTVLTSQWEGLSMLPQVERNP